MIHHLLAFVVVVFFQEQAFGMESNKKYDELILLANKSILELKIKNETNKTKLDRELLNLNRKINDHCCTTNNDYLKIINFYNDFKTISRIPFQKDPFQFSSKPSTLQKGNSLNLDSFINKLEKKQIEKLIELAKIEHLFEENLKTFLEVCKINPGLLNKEKIEEIFSLEKNLKEQSVDIDILQKLEDFATKQTKRGLVKIKEKRELIEKIFSLQKRRKQLFIEEIKNNNSKECDVSFRKNLEKNILINNYLFLINDFLEKKWNSIKNNLNQILIKNKQLKGKEQSKIIKEISLILELMHQFIEINKTPTTVKKMDTVRKETEKIYELIVKNKIEDIKKYFEKIQNLNEIEKKQKEELNIIKLNQEAIDFNLIEIKNKCEKAEKIDSETNLKWGKSLLLQINNSFEEQSKNIRYLDELKRSIQHPSDRDINGIDKDLENIQIIHEKKAKKLKLILNDQDLNLCDKEVIEDFNEIILESFEEQLELIEDQFYLSTKFFTEKNLTEFNQIAEKNRKKIEDLERSQKNYLALNKQKTRTRLDSTHKNFAKKLSNFLEIIGDKNTLNEGSLQRIKAGFNEKKQPKMGLEFETGIFQIDARGTEEKKFFVLNYKHNQDRKKDFKLIIEGDTIEFSPDKKKANHNLEIKTIGGLGKEEIIKANAEINYLFHNFNEKLDEKEKKQTIKELNGTVGKQIIKELIEQRIKGQTKNSKEENEESIKEYSIRIHQVNPPFKLNEPDKNRNFQSQVTYQTNLKNLEKIHLYEATDERTKFIKSRGNQGISQSVNLKAFFRKFFLYFLNQKNQEETDLKPFIESHKELVTNCSELKNKTDNLRVFSIYFMHYFLKNFNSTDRTELSNEPGLKSNVSILSRIPFSKLYDDYLTNEEKKYFKECFTEFLKLKPKTIEIQDEKIHFSENELNLMKYTRNYPDIEKYCLLSQNKEKKICNSVNKKEKLAVSNLKNEHLKNEEEFIKNETKRITKEFLGQEKEKISISDWLESIVNPKKRRIIINPNGTSRMVDLLSPPPGVEANDLSDPNYSKDELVDAMGAFYQSNASIYDLALFEHRKSDKLYNPPKTGSTEEKINAAKRVIIDFIKNKKIKELEMDPFEK